MRQANEPLIIEDLIDIGFDEGLAKGVQQGRLDMARESLLISSRHAG